MIAFLAPEFDFGVPYADNGFIVQYGINLL